MFKFALDCINPFYKEIDSFESKDYFHWEPKLTQHKAMNLQISKFGAFTLFNFDLDIRFEGQDHAGPQLTVSVLGYFFNLHLYDTRHWDYDNDCWQQTVDTLL